MQNYSEFDKEIRRRMKVAKQNWIIYRCKGIDSGTRTGNSKAAFDTLKLLTLRQQTETKLNENTKGNSLAQEKVSKRGTECCTELCSYKLNTDANILKNEDKTYKKPTIRWD